ncbi:MAG TPA: 1-(5-phosphoribosyl)-5-[(5-phosphoribosylamino)methylideneamino] imidazole-4-carboxamide isomerase [Gemmatimonadales bacterium]|nr:1-(5-phosphoribosyl)-5-[(5-phosphoribosylamino)methylideneamino] imidazole-4-carboxamide isomerase [Gemmatimonadales bacterium]
MDILPAIDIRKGRVVRLSQGEAARETVYADDPVAQAELFLAAGARWLHVVDLDRAFGDGSNVATVGRIARAAEGRACVQYGGGLRTLDAISEALDAGVTRAVIGTAAVSDPALVARAVAAHGAPWLAVGLDAREGKVAVRGWTESSGLTLVEVAQRVVDAGARTLVYTDIARDGMLSGPDLAGCTALAQLGVGVIASGGFATLADVRRAADSGVAGAILGRSLYERTIDLAEALAHA